MSSYKPLTIAPLKTGLQTSVEPWIAPKDSFSVLENYHVTFGRIQKRNGYQQFGALTAQGSTVNISTITQANPGQVTTSSSHGLSDDDWVFIQSVSGMTEVNKRLFQVTVVDSTNFTIGVDTTNFTSYSSGGTIIKADSSTDRVMGIYLYVENTGTYSTLAFNTRRAYLYSSGSNTFSELDAADIFSGGDTDYIWAWNWQSASLDNRLYFTNGLQDNGAGVNGIRYYDSQASTTTTSALTTQSLGGGGTLYGAKILLTLQERLILLSTWEDDGSGVVQHPQRARWCARQDPTDWDDTVQGKGSFKDAATGEEIVSAQPLKNEIMVFFTNSVWSLRPTGDPKNAFQWSRLNSFRACDGLQASAPFDSYVVAAGYRGIYVTNGAQTSRIDEKIQNFMRDYVDIQEFSKAFVNRDYANERTWMLYTQSANSTGENDRALIYDENMQAFSIYNVGLNCLGYGSTSLDAAYEDFDGSSPLLPDWAYNDAGDGTYQNFYYNDESNRLLGGDIFGNVFSLGVGVQDYNTDIDTNFVTAAWNPYIEEGAQAKLGYVDFFVDTDPTGTATVFFYKDGEYSSYFQQEITFLPDLNPLAKISNIEKTNPAKVHCEPTSLQTGDTAYIYGVKGMTQINSDNLGEFTLTRVNDTTFTLDGVDATGFDDYASGGQLVEKEFYRTKTWKRVYVGATGFQHTLEVTTTGGTYPITFHAFEPKFKPVSTRLES